MGKKMIYIPIDNTQINSFVDYNKWLKCFDTQFNEPTNQISIKVPKVVKPLNKKTLLFNFGN